MKTKSIVILGGGFAGARAAQELCKSGFTNVLLIDRKDYFEVTYATLRGLMDLSVSERARVEYSSFLKCDFKKGEVAELGLNVVKLAKGAEFTFDIAIIATGSSYKSFSLGKSIQAMTAQGRKEEFMNKREQLKVAQNILIMGGGPVGVELAGEIADYFPNKNITISDVEDRLLNDLKPKASSTALRLLNKTGVRILTNRQLTKNDDVYKNADLIFKCFGLTPNTAFMMSKFEQVLNDDGRIQVDEFFRVKGLDHIFAFGDCASIPQVKFGYVADAQGLLMAKNLSALARNKPMTRFKAQPVASLIPIGRENGLAQLPFGITTLKFILAAKQKDMFISKQFKNLGISR